MLAENITEWTRQWKREGFEEGLEKGREEALERLRGALLRELEERFGVIPESVRENVAALDSFEEIAKLIARTATASSLAAMDF